MMRAIGSYITTKKKCPRAIVADEQTIKHVFSRVVRTEYGRQGEINIVPHLLKGDVLFVKIVNSLWAQEMWMRREFFVNKVNDTIGTHVIAHIKIAT